MLVAILLFDHFFGVRLSLTFHVRLSDKEVRLFPQLVTLRQVSAEVELVLHHILGYRETDWRIGGGRYDSGKTALATAGVAGRLK